VWLHRNQNGFHAHGPLPCCRSAAFSAGGIPFARGRATNAALEHDPKKWVEIFGPDQALKVKLPASGLEPGPGFRPNGLLDDFFALYVASILAARSDRKQLRLLFFLAAALNTKALQNEFGVPQWHQKIIH
jgi:hypothetical protein